MPCVFLFTYFICFYARKLRTIVDLQVGFLTQDTHKGFALLLCFLPHCHLFEIVCVCVRACVHIWGGSYFDILNNFQTTLNVNQ